MSQTVVPRGKAPKAGPPAQARKAETPVQQVGRVLKAEPALKAALALKVELVEQPAQVEPVDPEGTPSAAASVCLIGLTIQMTPEPPSPTWR